MEVCRRLSVVYLIECIIECIIPGLRETNEYGRYYTSCLRHIRCCYRPACQKKTQEPGPVGTGRGIRVAGNTDRLGFFS